jgi:hypothetical protein
MEFQDTAMQLGHGVKEEGGGNIVFDPGRKGVVNGREFIEGGSIGI